MSGQPAPAQLHCQSLPIPPPAHRLLYWCRDALPARPGGHRSRHGTHVVPKQATLLVQVLHHKRELLALLCALHGEVEPRAVICRVRGSRAVHPRPHMELRVVRLPGQTASGPGVSSARRSTPPPSLLRHTCSTRSQFPESKLEENVRWPRVTSILAAVRARAVQLSTGSVCRSRRGFGTKQQLFD